jgi:hypothetical protein
MRVIGTIVAAVSIPCLACVNTTLNHVIVQSERRLYSKSVMQKSNASPYMPSSFGIVMLADITVIVYKNVDDIYYDIY